MAKGVAGKEEEGLRERKENGIEEKQAVEEGSRDETCVHQCVISLNVMYNHNLSFGTS